MVLDGVAGADRDCVIADGEFLALSELQTNQRVQTESDRECSSDWSDGSPDCVLVATGVAGDGDHLCGQWNRHPYWWSGAEIAEDASV